MKFPLLLRQDYLTFNTRNTVGAGLTVYPECIYQGAGNAGGFNASEISSTVFIVTRAGLIQNFYVYVEVAPGVGQSFTYTVRVNNVPTAIQVIISGASATGNDTVNNVNVAVGDVISISLVTSAGASVTRHLITGGSYIYAKQLNFESVTSNTRAGTIAANTTRYPEFVNKQISFSGGVWASDFSVNARIYFTRSGTLKNLCSYANIAPGAGESFTYQVFKNGVLSSLTTVTPNLNTRSQDTATILPVVKGDYVYLVFITSLLAAASTHGICFDFEDGDYRVG